MSGLVGIQLEYGEALVVPIPKSQGNVLTQHAGGKMVSGLELGIGGQLMCGSGSAFVFFNQGR